MFVDYYQKKISLIVMFGVICWVGVAQASPLVSAGSSWRYDDTGTDLHSVGWPLVDDTGWSSGSAPLGYGDPHIVTTIYDGGSSKYPCYYFRYIFNIADPSAYGSLILKVLRDDGCVVYLNGTEVARSNMPSGEITYNTWASSAAGGADETTWYEFSVNGALLVAGTNVLAVEVHQANSTSSDLGFDLELDVAPPPTIIKGPYLQQLTPESMVIMWETEVAADSWVDYGLAAPNEYYVEGPTGVTIHEVQLTGLSPDTTYYYTVTSGGVTSTFATAPAGARSFRFVAYGDTRTDPGEHAAVIQGIINSAPELVLHTGDLVENGKNYNDWEAQFFDPAYALMINTPLLAVLGNHEYNGSGQLWFLDFFSLPNNEEWFAFTYGDVRFIGLNTMTDYISGSPQYNWLVAELQSPEYASSTWHIVYFHHPPYTATSSHSDEVGVQEHLVPLFEDYGVDMVFNGHSHVYEKYFHNGIYYIVTGGGGAPLTTLVEDIQEPIRQVGVEAYHHCVIDVNVPDWSLTFSARYNDGVEFDTITLYKGPVPNAPSNLTATAVSKTQIDLVWVDNSTDEDGFKIDRSLDGINYTLLDTVGSDVTTYSDVNLAPGTTYYYDVYAFNANENSNYARPSATTPVNQPPVADDQSVTTPEDAPVDITLTGSDPDGDPLTYSVVTGPSHGNLSGTAPNMTYTADPDFNGSDSFTFKVNDGVTDSNAATVTITVEPVSDPPVADDQDVTTKQDTPVDITLTASDVDGDLLTYSVVTDPTNGTLSGTAPSLTYTPNAGFTGSDNFTFDANDGMLESNIATVSITVAANNPPVADSQSVATDEDTPVDITLTGSDFDGDPLTYSVVQGPANGSLSGTAPNVTYTPNANFNGPDSFTFKVNDGMVDSVPATVSITVDPVNDPPEITSSPVTTATEDTLYTYDVEATDPDVGDTLAYSLTTAPSGMTINSTTGLIQWTPTNAQVGDNNIEVKVEDGGGASDIQSFTITVTNTNDPPEITSSPVTTATEDTLYTYDVEATDPDVGDTLTYSLTTAPSGMTINATTGLIQWTPTNAQVGDNNVEVKVEDGGGASDIQSFTITVSAAPSDITVFSDSFEVSEWNGLWTEDSQNDWFRSTQRAVDGSYCAEVDGSATDAALTSIPIDLQGRTNATITFSWYIESGLDSGEYLAFDVSTDGGTNWTQMAQLSGNVDTENTWHNESIDLSGINSLRIRFRAKMSRYNEDANVDMVNVIAS